VTEKYGFIDAEKFTVTDAGEKKYNITMMCKWLGVSKSVYYEWCGRPESATAARRVRLAELIEELFEASDATYGHRRIHAELVRRGESAAPELVRRIMRDLGLEPCQPRPWRLGLTDSSASLIPDVVGRDFTATAPGQKMVGDITYIPTWEGWVYLATVIDCHTKAVIGWAIDDNYQTPSSRKKFAWLRATTLSGEAQYFTPIVAVITPRFNLRTRIGRSAYASRSDVPVSVTTTRWRSRFSGH
jgi:putative transposase